MLLGVGAKKSSVFVDDVFSTHVYAGNSTARSINNGLDLSGEGGMVWIKSRDNAYDHYIVDTERGALNRIRSNSSGGSGSAAETLTAFNNNGFALGTDSINLVVNASNKTYSSWSFRKSPAFTICEWTGNNSTNQTISHQLGSIPGCIMIKSTSHTDQWTVYHRGAGQDKYLYLNESDSASSSGSPDWSNISSTSFEALGATSSNENGYEYVAYLFAGGESDAATARSVEFNGSNIYLTVASSADLTFGTGDFSIEFWANPDDFDSRGTFYDSRPSDGTTGITIGHESSSGEIRVYMNASSGSDIVVKSSDFERGQWQHIAVTRSSGTVRLFINGILKDSGTRTSDLNNTNAVNIGYKTYTSSGYAYFDGKISNLRVVKGTPVYTSSFRLSTEPLTNITNTKLLCCNNSDVTGKIVGPTITDTFGTASSDSPFDDPAAHVFGASGSESVIATGSYQGNGSTDGPEIFLGNGWEPQWVLIKNTTTAKPWCMHDMMRGFWNNGTADDITLFSNLTNSELAYGVGEFTSTGFKLRTNDTNWNKDGDKYIYMCLRRPDGYVGKPPELGTGVFAMDTGAGGSTIPNFDSLFPVDFSLGKTVASATDWFANARLIGQKELTPNTTAAEGSAAYATFDSNLGWGNASWQDSTVQSWMWKRHAGFTTVTYKGDGVAGRQIAHDMNNTVEMIWTKRRSPAAGWRVWHKGLNGGGSNAATYYLSLNETTAQTSNGDIYGSSSGILPTSTHWTVGSNAAVNESGSDFISMLFSSVDGISKVGSYAGSGSSRTISLGFSPRLLILKNITSADSWYVMDTTRGWGSGNDNYLELNTSTEQGGHDFGAPTSDGFSLPNGNVHHNQSGQTYIYYCHA